LIGKDLKSLADAPDATLIAANTALTRFLPLQIDRLRSALDAKPVTAADVPADIARDWVLPDGRARVQVLSKPAARDSAGLHEFVAQVLSVAPDAGGSAVGIVQTSATIISAFRSAAIGALIAIAVILFAVLRRPLDVALVMAPLLLSALMTAILAVVLPLPLNFANIIALPLLLGVGVSFNIYFVMNWRQGGRRFLGSATARAIVFSALTTGTAFGSLALSRHPGTASMGELLLLSLGCTLVATLVFVPTLLLTLRRT
jgi:predicted RND superfamily exporter protein